MNPAFATRLIASAGRNSRRSLQSSGLPDDCFSRLTLAVLQEGGFDIDDTTLLKFVRILSMPVRRRSTTRTYRPDIEAEVDLPGLLERQGRL